MARRACCSCCAFNGTSGSCPTCISSARSGTPAFFGAGPEPSDLVGYPVGLATSKRLPEGRFGIFGT